MSTEKKRALGRGLDALLPSRPPPPASGGASGSSDHASGSGPSTTTGSAPRYGDGAIYTLPIERIVPQTGQPRQHFDESELQELTTSIKEHGVIQPLLVRRLSGEAGREKYELVAGERRWRASQRAGLKDIPVFVKDITPTNVFELALVENLQRADLNPIEVAESYERLIKEHAYTHDVLAERVGKERVTITNSLRLLKLPQAVRTLVVSRELSEGHARALLGAPDDKALADIAEKTLRGRLPVRKVEELVRKAKAQREGKKDDKPGREQKSAAVRDLEARLARRFGARVEVRDDGGSGELAIHYGSLDELDRILGLLGA